MSTFAAAPEGPSRQGKAGCWAAAKAALPSGSSTLAAGRTGKRFGGWFGAAGDQQPAEQDDAGLASELGLLGLGLDDRLGDPAGEPEGQSKAGKRGWSLRKPLSVSLVATAQAHLCGGGTAAEALAAGQASPAGSSAGPSSPRAGTHPEPPPGLWTAASSSDGSSAAAEAEQQAQHERRRRWSLGRRPPGEGSASSSGPADPAERRKAWGLGGAWRRHPDADADAAAPPSAAAQPAAAPPRAGWGRRIAPDSPPAGTPSRRSVDSDPSIGGRDSERSAHSTAASSPLGRSSQGTEPGTDLAAAAASLDSPLGSPGSPASPAGTSAPGSQSGSYRRIWSSIAGVRRGDRLPAAAAGAPQAAEVTVDELVRAVKALAPGDRVLESLESKLALIDSRAAAALLKELSRAGLGHRASELFDALRALPEGSPLGRLVDLYTYTTIISHCGSHQQLRRALELVAEMRGRGVPCNIHTYSALMGVCVKCNECELALDVYDALGREGLSPNLVTYNILVDIHAKAGAWDRCVQVLDDIAAKLPGARAEARTYNTVIAACSRAAQPEAARGVYERMLADGVRPTGTTYTLLISAYGKAGMVEDALAVYQDMVSRGCERNVITYGSLICAAERAGRADLAAQLFEEMQRDGCRPNIVTYNALIGAYAHAGRWREASDVAASMQRGGCRPDSATHGLLLLAFEQGGQWERALQALEGMQRQGLRVDAAAYSAAIGALWASGLAGPQLRAVQLAAAAHRSGHMRPAAGAGGELAAAAGSPGAAVLVTMRWLWDLREAPLLAALSGGAPLSLQLLRGRHARGEGPAGTAAALRALLASFGAPLSVEANSRGVLVSAEPLVLGPWLAGPGAAALLSPLAAAAAVPAAATPALLAADRAAEARCCKAFAAVLEFEHAHAPPAGAPPAAGAAASVRDALGGAVVSLASALGAREETVHDALHLLDRALAAGLAPEPGAELAYAFALLLLVSRQTGDQTQLLGGGALAFQLYPGFTLAAASTAEAAVAAALGGDTGAISALRVLQLFLERLGCAHPELQASQLCRLMGLTAVDAVTKAALCPAFAALPPSAVAAAAVVASRRALGLAPHWPPALAAMTGYEVDAPEGPVQAALGPLTASGI